jgi:hypothetical protein
MNADRPELSLSTNAVISNSTLKTNPLVLTTDSVRETMVPAISLALGRLNALNTRKALGATVALKKTAAPSQEASSSSLMLLRVDIVKPV